MKLSLDLESLGLPLRALMSAEALKDFADVVTNSRCVLGRGYRFVTLHEIALY
jgi:hypothetical protein